MGFSKMIRTLVSITIGIVFSLVMGCVSVKIGGSVPQKSQDMKYRSPTGKFEEVKSNEVDHSWRNTQNGNTISILSECGDPTDPSLEQIQTGIISEIEHSQVLELHHIDYNARDGVHSLLEGRVDGVPTRFELVIFKKNNCTYVLSYAAVAKSFGDNQRDFESFVKGFKVP
jgi:hypothetical protein